MSQKTVVIKGTRDGISIILRRRSDFETIRNTILERLQGSGNFFRGGEARLLVKEGQISPEEMEELEAMLKEYGLNLKKDHPLYTISPTTHQLPETLVLKKTLRSGQRIVYGGNVVIVGDVNPGSEVVAKGDILVFGVLRGMAHAGAEGDADAIVAAYRLQPTQLRIAGVIARPPEGKNAVPQEPEVARLKNGVIVIEPYHLH